MRDVDRGQTARNSPGQILFKDMIESRLAFLRRTATTPRKLMVTAKLTAQSIWWLRFFGNKKLIQYRKVDSDAFQKWYVDQRGSFYLAHPESRNSAVNGAVAVLRGLRRFCQDYAEDEETGWWPDIKIPEGEDIPPGPFFTRPQQAALLLACRGWVKDKRTGQWKTRSYVDEKGKVRTTRRIRSSRIVATRRGKSRLIRLGIRTGAREQDLISLVWGEAPHTACVAVDDDGAGMFHRRGLEEPDNNKSRPTSLVADRLRCLLRIWKKEDGQSARVTELDKKNKIQRKKHRYLVRRANGQHYQRITIAGIVADAGLSPKYTEHALRRTAVEEAHRQCWSSATATHMIGMTIEVLWKFYTDWGERAVQTKAPALQEANSVERAPLLRRNARTEPQPGDRVRDYDRRVAHLRDQAAAAEPESTGEGVLRFANCRASAWHLRNGAETAPRASADRRPGLLAAAEPATAPGSVGVRRRTATTAR
jgi:hypothetical protein